MIVGAIVSTRFLRQFAALEPLPLLDNKPLRTISELCLGYFKDHAEAPNSHVGDLWTIRKEELVEQGDDAQAELIDTILQSLVDELEAATVRFNTDYALSVAERYLRLRKLKQVSDQVRGSISQKDPDQAEGTLAQYKPIRLVTGNGASPIEQGFFDDLFVDDVEPPLLKFPSALGKLLNKQFFRSAFVAFMGNAKAGKSWLLMEIALRAWWQRCNVAYCVVGDMSLRQVKERLASSMTRRPVARLIGKERRAESEDAISADDAIWTVQEQCRRWERCEREERKPTRVCQACPKFIPVIQREQVAIHPFSQKHLLDASRQWGMRTKGKTLRVECFPSGSKSIRDIDGILDGWQHFSGFLLDVLVIDYADILAPVSKREQERDQINETWQHMNQLAQRRNCLVVTATQSDAEGYDKKRLTKKNFSSDRRKNDHVSAQYGITKSSDDKDLGDCVRISEVMEPRFGQSNKRQVIVHRALDTGRFYGASEWEKTREENQ